MTSPRKGDYSLIAYKSLQEQGIDWRKEPQKKKKIVRMNSFLFLDLATQFIQTYTKVFTIIALVIALLGAILLAWDYLQWSNVSRWKSDSDFGIPVSMEERIGKQKLGSILIALSIIIQLTVELFRKS